MIVIVAAGTNKDKVVEYLKSEAGIESSFKVASELEDFVNKNWGDNIPRMIDRKVFSGFVFKLQDLGNSPVAAVPITNYLHRNIKDRADFLAVFRDVYDRYGPSRVLIERIVNSLKASETKYKDEYVIIEDVSNLNELKFLQQSFPLVYTVGSGNPVANIWHVFEVSKKTDVEPVMKLLEKEIKKDKKKKGL